MERVTVTAGDLERMAARIGLPLDDATREATRAAVEAWLNDANDLRAEMEQPVYDGLSPLCEEVGP